MFGNRRLWPSLAGVVVVLAAFALVLLGGPALIPVPPVGKSGVTIAGQLTMEQIGTTVSAHVTVSADRVVTLRKLAVRVRDTRGAFHDFPDMANVELTTTPREIELNRNLDTPGDYTYYLAYQLDTDWVSLPPWQTITIR